LQGMPLPALIGALILLAAVSVLVSPRVRTADGFFRGSSNTGQAPDVVTLTLSQVTTWIFARSLLNAGILGYFFGIAGALAYTAYYGSFLTGWLIVDRLRYRHGVTNIQTFVTHHFGRLGTGCFNLLISMRLLTEVFANLLVVGIVFGAAGSVGYNVAIITVALVTLVYSMTGGLRASLRTDLWQMTLLGVLLIGLTAMMFVHPFFEASALLESSAINSPGWILLVVALLQVLSYPMHDPVMMDRGFLADRSTTRQSFLHAFWISSLCILAFGFLGVFAGLHRQGEEELIATLARLLGTPAMLVLGLALFISAASTLDSAFSSASKLAVVDMGLGEATARNGRLAMLCFAVGGLLLVLFGTDDLFAAVAVSGTASLFLTPVIVFCIFAERRVRPWCFFVTFAAAVGGAAAYFVETSGYSQLIGRISGLEHDYAKLLLITVVVLVVGLSSFAMALQPRSDNTPS